MQLRDDGNGEPIPYPNKWNFLGGGVEGNESHAEAATREIKEETNIRIDALALIQIFVYDHDQTINDHIFICQVPENTTEELLEGAAMEWLTFDEIAQLELGFEQSKILPSLEAYLKRL